MNLIPTMSASTQNDIESMLDTVPIVDIENFDFKTFEAQKKINLIQGKNNLWFCGAYLGYGFHEDGIKSGERVAKKILKDL